MLTKQANVVMVFLKEPWKKLTFQEIKKALRSSSNSYLQKNLKSLVEEGFIKNESVGNVHLYYLHLASPKTRGICAYVNQYFSWKLKLPYKLLEEFTKILSKEIYCLLVTGSYATQTFTNKSDIDLVIIADNPKRLDAETRQFCELSTPSIHLYVFTPEEVLAMFVDKHPNYGTEFLKKHLLLYGGEFFYACVHEAMTAGPKHLYPSIPQRTFSG